MVYISILYRSMWWIQNTYVTCVKHVLQVFVTCGSFSILERVHFCWQVYCFEIFQVLFDLFRHDVRLWKTYSTTMEVYLFVVGYCVGMMTCRLEWTKYDVPICFVCTTVTPSIYRISRFAGRPGTETFISFKCRKKVKVNINLTFDSCWLDGFLIDHVTRKDYASFPLDMIVGTRIPSYYHVVGNELFYGVNPMNPEYSTCR